MDSSLDLVPGRLQASHCSWAVLEEGQSWMGKRQKINSPRHQACVCVSCVASIYSRVCSSVSCVPIKPDKFSPVLLPISLSLYCVLIPCFFPCPPYPSSSSFYGVLHQRPRALQSL